VTMSGGALINLVRLNTIDEVDDHDYTEGELFERHDEIKLENPDGCPCAIPAPTGFDNIDYPLNFITGAIGHQTRVIRRNLSLSIDYITNEKARRLEHWMQQRAKVLVCPNYGRNTEFAFRPILMDGTTYLNGGTAYDLTGNHAIKHTQSSGTLLLWDEAKRRFAKKPVSDVLQIFHTPGGAAVGAPRNIRNLMSPAYPKGAGSATGGTNSGWVKGGTDVAQITFTHNSGGFGHPDCPDSLKVAYTDDVSNLRHIEVKGLFDPGDGNYGGYTPTGGGDMVFCIWVRGQLPEDALILLTGATGTTPRALGAKRFDGWTPLIITRNEADWSLSVPSLTLYLSSSDGVSGSFEIGPTQCQQAGGGAYSGGGYWTDSSSYAGTNDIETVSGVAMPEQGSLVTSFFVPDWLNETYALKANVAFFGTTSLDMRVIKDYSGDQYIFVRDSAGGNESFNITTTSPLLPGEINTAAFVWNGDVQSVYVNGVHVGDVDMATNKIDFGSSATAIRIGKDGSGHHAYPGLILSVRVDEGAMTAGEVYNIHLALTDPIALQFAAIQRGRVYQITGIPQTIRSAAGGSHVLGMLQLKQVDFQHWLADPLNLEETVL